MEPNTTNSVPPVPPATTAPQKAKPSYGGLLAIIIILVLIVVGALYFWGQRVAEEAATPEAQVEDLQTQGDSTDVSAIEADLNTQTPDDFDADVDAALGELDAAFEAQ